jgi:thymidylate synthase
MSIYRNVNEALPSLARRILDEGACVPSRAGATKELTFQHFTITHPLEREIVIPGRKANIAAQIAETMWVLSGRNDIEWLSAYLPRAAEFSDDGKTWRAGYGPRLRKWSRGMTIGASPMFVDQMQEVISLLVEDPSTRRAVMSIFDPAVDYQDSKDIPCNNWLHFLARDGFLDLHVAIRSNDLVWGWSGINQFEWSVLLEVVAAYSNLGVGRIHYAVSSLHIYERHWDRSRLWEPAQYPTQSEQRFRPRGISWDRLTSQWFALEQMIRAEPQDRGEVMAEIREFPEPMLRSWLYLLSWWTGDYRSLYPLKGTRLQVAADEGTGPRKTPAHTFIPSKEDSDLFVEEVTRLHLEKDAAYGTSWKKRGELFSILPNIARKADRLGAGDTTDENQTDTAIDLMVYLAKYRTFLSDAEAVTSTHSEDPKAANQLISDWVGFLYLIEKPWTIIELENELKEGVEQIMYSAENKDPLRYKIVDRLLEKATVLAMRRWLEAPALFSRSEQYRGADHE